MDVFRISITESHVRKNPDESSAIVLLAESIEEAVGKVKALGLTPDLNRLFRYDYTPKSKRKLVSVERVTMKGTTKCRCLK